MTQASPVGEPVDGALRRTRYGEHGRARPHVTRSTLRHGSSWTAGECCDGCWRTGVESDLTEACSRRRHTVARPPPACSSCSRMGLATALQQMARVLPPWLTVDAATRAFGWGVCASYVMAFGSFYPQIGGMLGPVRGPHCDWLALRLAHPDTAARALAGVVHRTVSSPFFRECRRTRSLCRCAGCAAQTSELISCASVHSRSRWLGW